MHIDLIGESVKFLILGMFIVFMFLLLLVQMMKLQAYLIGRFFKSETSDAPVAATGSKDQKSHHIAAITAAIGEHLKSKSS